MSTIATNRRYFISHCKDLFKQGFCNPYDYYSYDNLGITSVSFFKKVKSENRLFYLYGYYCNILNVGYNDLTISLIENNIIILPIKEIEALVFPFVISHNSIVAPFLRAYKEVVKGLQLEENKKELLSWKNNLDNNRWLYESNRSRKPKHK